MPTPKPQNDQLSLGIVILLASVTAMAFADAVVKLVSANLTLWQVFVTRSCFAIPCLLWIARASPSTMFSRVNRWVVLRSLLLVFTWLAFYGSLPVLNLSTAAVAVYTNPIITVLLTAWLLGERVLPRQWGGILFGFIGVTLILKPGTDSFTSAILLPLAGAFFYASAMVLTRRKCQQQSPVVLALTLHIAFIVTGLLAVAIISLTPIDSSAIALYPFVLDSWPTMHTNDWMLMAGLGVLSAAYFLGVARAYQIAPPQIIATFDYGYLVSAVIWGMIFFAEIPDTITVLGMLLITLAGLLVSRASRSFAN